MRSLLIALTVLTLGAGAAAAQDSSQVTPVPLPAPVPAGNNTAIRPGMSEADVRARWGDPAATKTINDWKYMFYRNYEERSVGFLDVVMLQGGQVVDALVRGSDHVYLGQSSSPGTRAPEMTPPSNPRP